MPISADRFEDIPEDEDGRSPGTNAHEILSFLEANPEQAFTRSEIASETSVTEGSVGPTLVRLRERGRVDHRGRYWRISDHVRRIEAASNHAGQVAASHEDESMAYDEWHEYAVDPRDERE